jgi:hypothetical protein
LGTNLATASPAKSGDEAAMTRPKPPPPMTPPTDHWCLKRMFVAVTLA